MRIRVVGHGGEVSRAGRAHGGGDADRPVDLGRSEVQNGSQRRDGRLLGDDLGGHVSLADAVTGQEGGDLTDVAEFDDLVATVLDGQR